MLTTKLVSIATAVAVAGVLVVGGSYVAKESEEHSASRAKVTAVLAAKTGAVDAIRAAEAKSGGRAVDFGLRNRDTSSAYEIQVLTAAGLINVVVDPGTGAAVPSTESTGKSDADQLHATSTTLAAAVAAAERQSGGRALEARASVSTASRCSS